MKILAIADEPDKSLWDYYEPGKLEGLDLILSAGDLPASYLSFLVTFAPCPVLYVPGNHDGRYSVAPPEGCESVDDRIYTFQGLRILGLGGSMLYNGGPYQYTEKQMEKRVRHLRRQLRKHKGFDLLLTHAPARGCGDMDDEPHRGFTVFHTLLDRYHPRYMIHGHVHMNYGANMPRTLQCGETTIINAYRKYLMEI